MVLVLGVLKRYLDVICSLIRVDTCKTSSHVFYDDVAWKYIHDTAILVFQICFLEIVSTHLGGSVSIVISVEIWTVLRTGARQRVRIDAERAIAFTTSGFSIAASRQQRYCRGQMRSYDQGHAWC